VASQQFFGALLAAGAVLVGYLAYKGRLTAIWQAALGAGTQSAATDPNAMALGAQLGAGMGSLQKYSVSIGKTGVILSGGTLAGPAPTQPTTSALPTPTTPGPNSSQMETCNIFPLNQFLACLGRNAGRLSVGGPGN